MHLKAHSTRYRMNIWLSGRFEGVLEIWASENGPKSRLFLDSDPRFFLFTNPCTGFAGNGTTKERSAYDEA